MEAYILFTLDLASFPFTYFALYPFAVLTHSCKCDYMLSPVSPSSKPVNLGVAQGLMTYLIF